MPVAIFVSIVLPPVTLVSLFEVSLADAASLAAWSVVTASRVWPVADSAGD